MLGAGAPDAAPPPPAVEPPPPVAHSRRPQPVSVIRPDHDHNIANAAYPILTTFSDVMVARAG